MKIAWIRGAVFRLWCCWPTLSRASSTPSVTTGAIIVKLGAIIFELVFRRQVLGDKLSVLTVQAATIIFKNRIHSASSKSSRTPTIFFIEILLPARSQGSTKSVIRIRKGNLSRRRKVQYLLSIILFPVEVPKARLTSLVISYRLNSEDCSTNRENCSFPTHWEMPN